jgi:hypothetical protein
MLKHGGSASKSSPKPSTKKSLHSHSSDVAALEHALHHRERAAAVPSVFEINSGIERIERRMSRLTGACVAVGGHEKDEL